MQMGKPAVSQIYALTFNYWYSNVLILKSTPSVGENASVN